MTEEQLEENGYPRLSPDTPGKAVIRGTRYQETDALLKGQWLKKKKIKVSLGHQLNAVKFEHIFIHICLKLSDFWTYRLLEAELASWKMLIKLHQLPPT